MRDSSCKTWYCVEMMMLTKTLSSVFVSTETSKDWILVEMVPTFACPMQGIITWHPGCANRSNLPHVAMTPLCIKERERKKCAITTRVSGALARVVASIFSTRARLSLQKRSRAKRYINFASVQFQSGARRRRRRKKATERCEREKTYITRAEERTMCLGRRRSSKPLFIYLCLCVCVLCIKVKSACVSCLNVVTCTKRVPLKDIFGDNDGKISGFEVFEVFTLAIWMDMRTNTTLNRITTHINSV